MRFIDFTILYIYHNNKINIDNYFLNKINFLKNKK